MVLAMMKPIIRDYFAAAISLFAAYLASRIFPSL